LQGAQEIGPEIHELTLPAGLKALLFQVGSTALAVPEGLARGAAVPPMGQTEAERFRAWATIELAKASALQQLARVHRGDAVDTADLRKGQPLG
jgi:hypothetical protein